MKIMFLGTDACLSAAGNDASGILVDRKYLVDTGYYVVDRLLSAGVDPTSVKRLFFTHMHHDHYLGLPQFLFRYLQSGKRLDELNVYGPKADVARVVGLSMKFLQAGDDELFYHGLGYPVINELSPGDSIKTDDMEISACASRHPVEGLCYRFTDRCAGKVLGLTGDTFYDPKIREFLSGCDTLVHEAALADSETDQENPPACLHSDVGISVSCAKETGAKKLFVIHFAKNKAMAVENKAEKLGFRATYPELLREYEI